MTEAHSKQFMTVREKLEGFDGKYVEDGLRCPVCNMTTVVGSDLKRRYCSSVRCHALILTED